MRKWAGFSGFLVDAGVLTGADGAPPTSRPDFATWFTNDYLQSWLEGVRARFDWTVLLLTHDVREAVFLSDRPAGRRTGLCRVV